MASRADRLHIVLEMAEKAENQAAEVFNQARTQHEQAQKKLEDLAAYCLDYQEGLGVLGGRQSAETIARSRGFLGQLMQAKRQQQQIVVQYLKLVEQKKQSWHKSHLKHRALKDLINRFKADDQKVLNRQEEKMLDEWVTLDFTRKNMANEARY